MSVLLILANSARWANDKRAEHLPQGATSPAGCHTRAKYSRDGNYREVTPTCSDLWRVLLCDIPTGFYMFNSMISVVSPSYFVEVRNGLKYPGSTLVYPYSPGELILLRSRCFIYFSVEETSPGGGGMGGVAVTKDGWLINLFSLAEGSGIGKSLIDQAINAGARRVVSFELPQHRNLYAKYGFSIVSRSPFDPQKAPPNWPAEWGTPDYLQWYL